MPVISATPDPQHLTLTIVADFAAPPERVWQVWSDPRQLEHWWGPPTWPATFTALDLTPGGQAAYYMTGPEGEKAAGWWRITSVDAPHGLDFEDGFSDATGEPDDSMPVTLAQVRLDPAAGGTRMTITSTFATAEEMEQQVGMGMVEGMSLAVGQVDALVAA